jgi:hypothetical protein
LAAISAEAYMPERFNKEKTEEAQRLIRRFEILNPTRFPEPLQYGVSIVFAEKGRKSGFSL